MVEHQTVINVSTSGGGGSTLNSLVCRNPEGLPNHTAIFDYQTSNVGWQNVAYTSTRTRTRFASVAYVQTDNHVLKVFYDGVLIYSMPYEGEIGEVLSISVNFKGTGSVDFVELKENGAATPTFREDFTVCPTTQRAFVSLNEAQTICSGQTIIFNNQTLNQSGAYQDTIAGMGCVDTLKTLNLTVSVFKTK